MNPDTALQFRASAILADLEVTHPTDARVLMAAFKAISDRADRLERDAIRQAGIRLRALTRIDVPYAVFKPGVGR